MKYLFIFCLITACLGCPAYDPPKGTLKIHNYSDSAIYVYQTCSDSIQKNYGLKLFLEINAKMVDADGNEVDPIYSPNYRVNAYNYSDLGPFGSSKNRQLPCNSQEMNLFFITESVMRKHTWDTIVLQQLYQKKVHITKAQLDSLGWQIKYVP